jgi:hypothetical protein
MKNDPPLLILRIDLYKRIIVRRIPRIGDPHRPTTHFAIGRQRYWLLFETRRLNVN